MKKIFTLAAILISMSVATFAADRPKKGKISVTSNSVATVFIKIDGQKFNLDRNEFVMNNIKPGNHRVEIYRMERGFLGTMKTKVIYSDFVTVAPDQLVNLNVNRTGGVVVRKSNAFDRDDRWDNDYGRNDRGKNDRGRDYDRKW